MKIEIGMQIGFLKVLRDSGERVKSYKIWICQCMNCGTIVLKSTEQLKTAKSCGCYRKERMSVSGDERKKIFKYDPDKAGQSHSLRGTPNKNNSSSGIRGVSWDKRKKKWTVQIMHKHVAYNLGRFKGLQEAAEIRWAAENAVRSNQFEQWLGEYRIRRKKT